MCTEAISFSWPFSRLPKESKLPDPALRQEDRETRLVVEKYMNLAEEFLSRTDPGPETETAPQAA